MVQKGIPKVMAIFSGIHVWVWNFLNINFRARKKSIR